MPTFDFEQQKIIARVVYDGIAYAGKTTNVRCLGDLFTGVRRSEMVVPEERNGRTLWFDWVQLEGGMICGYPLSCQIVTVPGQRVLEHRRRLLLGTADAVVFVADSSKRRLRRTREGVEVLRGILDGRGAHRPPLVLQANKRDRADAMSLDALAEGLGLSSGVPIVPAQAHEGIGVRETLIRVVRTLTEHVQQLAQELGYELPVRPPEAAADLHATMAEQEELDELGDVSLAEEADDATDEPAPAAISVPELLVTAAAPTTLRSPPPAASAAVPLLPRADALTGYVWPAMTARDILRDLEVAEHAAAEASEAREPGVQGDRIVCRVGGFLVRSSSRRYADSEEARAELIRMARGKSLIGDLQLPGTVLALQRDRDGAWRLWTVHRWVRTLHDDLEEGLRGGDEVATARTLGHFARIVIDAIVLASREHLAVSLALLDYGVAHDRTYYIGDEVGFASSLPDVGSALLSPLERIGGRFPEARALYVERLETSFKIRLTAVDIERVGVARALADARPDTPDPSVVVDRLLRALEPGRSAVGRRAAG